MPSETITGSFTATGNSGELFLRRGEGQLDYAVSGIFDATLVIQRSLTGRSGWQNVHTLTAPASGSLIIDPGFTDRYYRVCCSEFNSGQADYSISDGDAMLMERHASDGGLILQLTENGVTRVHRETSGPVHSLMVQADIAPDADSTAINFGLISKLNYTNPKGKTVSGAAHQAAILAWAVQNSTVDNPLMIAAESKIEKESAEDVVENAVAWELQLSKNLSSGAGKIGNFIAANKQITSNAGQVDLFAGGALNVVGNTGNITTIVNELIHDLDGPIDTIIGTWIKNQTKNSASSKYIVLNEDPGMVFSTVGEIHAKNLIQQIVDTPTAATSSGIMLIPLDTSKPTYAEGDQYMTATITPKDASNILYIEWELIFSTATTPRKLTVALFKDGSGTDEAIHAKCEYLQADLLHVIKGRHKMTAGGTSSTTFQIRAGLDTGSNTLYFNSLNGTQPFGGISYSSLKITEHRP